MVLFTGCLVLIPPDLDPALYPPPHFYLCHHQWLSPSFISRVSPATFDLPGPCWKQHGSPHTAPLMCLSLCGSMSPTRESSRTVLTHITRPTRRSCGTVSAEGRCSQSRLGHQREGWLGPQRPPTWFPWRRDRAGPALGGGAGVS